ncbi:uncharacterized protein LY89DRAFT_743236 [Mollisia scopiformis]|uniref:Rhodopsin domain-containing protein n=1 Tax=Mollisia scopiformis TaxID=149040 RepID=A0A132B5R9_MOLSC|nr:uncharacterized protein LY89DRAFT_743236 [Mollisia scopiformis]KUJ07234.1 hypothetical protein LY89DRAFT_743236 [Mollisia scopiformis]
MEALPPVSGWHTSLSVTIFVVCVVFAILTILFTVLRFIARSGKLATYGPDDWVLLCAAILSVAHAIMTAWGAGYGSIGTSVLVMSPLQISTFDKLLFASEFISLAALALVKISVLLFYRRLFSVTRFPIIANVVIGIIIAWFIAFFLVMLFAGDPISDSWTHLGHPRYNVAAMLVASSYTDIIIDIAVLALPIPLIKGLHLDTKRKLSVVGIFSLGLFCVVASSVRLHYFVQFSHLYTGENYDGFSRTVTLIFLWSNIEPCCSVIAACLPTLAPLFKDSHFGFFSRLRSYFSSRRSLASSTGEKKATLHQQQPFGRNSDSSVSNSSMPPRADWAPKISTSAYASAAPREDFDLERQEAAYGREIRVKSTTSLY